MKKAYLKIEIFQILVFILLLINSLIYRFLNSYYMIGFLVILLIIFKLLFGFEKDRHRYMKNTIMNILIYLLSFFVLYYLLGIIIDFARSGYYTLDGFITFTLRIAIYIVLKEFLRYNLVCKSEGSKINIVLSILTFIMLDITNNINITTLDSKYNIFIFIALIVLPAIGNNILGTYITMKAGYKPVIFYMLMTTLYPYVLPIVPDPNEYIASVINFSLPMLLVYFEYKFFKSEEDNYLSRDYNKRHFSLLIITLSITVVLVYFTSGYFHYHAIAIASGSMTPNINKGDVVIVEKIDGNYDNLQIGDIIAYKYNDTILVHRIINIIYDREQYYIYTKGDANNDKDNWVVESNMVEGIVKSKIPLIGYPTVWLNEL